MDMCIKHNVKEIFLTSLRSPKLSNSKEWVLMDLGVS